MSQFVYYKHCHLDLRSLFGYRLHCSSVKDIKWLTTNISIAVFTWILLTASSKASVFICVRQVVRLCLYSSIILVLLSSWWRHHRLRGYPWAEAGCPETSSAPWVSEAALQPSPRELSLELERAQNFRVVSCSGSSPSLGRVAGDIGSSFPSPWNSSSFSRA